LQTFQEADCVVRDRILTDALCNSVTDHFDVHVTVHRDKFLITKPTRSSNFSNLFLEGKSTCFEQFLCPSSGDFHCTHGNGICHTGLLTACKQEHLLLFTSC